MMAPAMKKLLWIALAVLLLALQLFAGPPEKFRFDAGPSLSGTEEYEIVATKGGFRVTGNSHLKRSKGHVDLSERLELDPEWKVTHYSVTVNITDPSAPTMDQIHQVQGFEVSVQKDKVQLKGSSGYEFSGTRAEMKPHTVVLDTMIVAHYQVLLDSLGAQPPARQALWVLVPQSMNAQEGTINAEKDDDGTLNGKPIVLHHFMAVLGGVTVQMWAEAGSNRLMRVSMPTPDHQLEITREGFAPAAPAQ